MKAVVLAMAVLLVMACTSPPSEDGADGQPGPKGEQGTQGERSVSEGESKQSSIQAMLSAHDRNPFAFDAEFKDRRVEFDGAVASIGRGSISVGSGSIVEGFKIGGGHPWLHPHVGFVQKGTRLPSRPSDAEAFCLVEDADQQKWSGVTEGDEVKVTGIAIKVWLDDAVVFGGCEYTPDLAPTQTGTSTDHVAQGKALYAGRGRCITCHTNENIPGATAELGPELTHIATEAEGREAGLSVEEYLRISIAGHTETIGATLHLTDGEVEALVAYLLTQK